MNTKLASAAFAAALALTGGALLAPGAAVASPSGRSASAESEGGTSTGTSGGSARVVSVGDALGATLEEMQAAGEAGQSLTEFAASRGISREELVDRLSEEGREQVEADVAAGRITAEEGEKRKAEMREIVGSLADQAPGEAIHVDADSDGPSGEMHTYSGQPNG